MKCGLRRGSCWSCGHRGIAWSGFSPGLEVVGYPSEPGGVGAVGCLEFLRFRNNFFLQCSLPS